MLANMALNGTADPRRALSAHREIHRRLSTGKCAMKISEEGIKPILSAMATHSANPSVQEKACGAILNLSEFGTATHKPINCTVRAVNSSNCRCGAATSEQEARGAGDHGGHGKPSAPRGRAQVHVGRPPAHHERRRQDRSSHLLRWRRRTGRRVKKDSNGNIIRAQGEGWKTVLTPQTWRSRTVRLSNVELHRACASAATNRTAAGAAHEQDGAHKE